MRSAREIVHRLRQELRNVQLLYERTRGAAALRSPFPAAASCAAAARNTRFAKNVLEIADAIRRHEFPLLGITINTGPEIRWRRDSINGKETGVQYFRLIPYLDAQRAGDHKIVWELNRHQHLVLLAQAYLVGGDRANLDEIAAEVDGWIQENPFQRGINWASALEVAFRALSWIWVLHLAGDALEGAIRTRMAEQLYLHGLHIENNLSYYFSPNTHLLGEAVALHAIAVMLPELPRAGTWRALGAQVVEQQMERQVRADGSHFEQSTYYHVYALDMFLFHACLTDVSEAYRAKLARMAGFLAAILGPSRKLPFIGDDDGGRFFHPYGSREGFGCATLATCGVFLGRPEWIFSHEDLYEQALWWLGPRVLDAFPVPAPSESRLFEDSGLAVMTSGETHVIVDAGPFGPWGSGHSHSDTLSVVVRRGDQHILIDPGTYTYVGDEHWRNWFRGSGAHNTIRIDRVDQATAVNPFRWENQPQVRMHKWESTASEDYLEAECISRGVVHRRRVRFVKPDTIVITDEISGPSGEHEIEQLWHPTSAEAAACIVVHDEVQHIDGWRSDAFGTKRPSPVLRVYRKCKLPVRFETRLELARVAHGAVAQT